MPKSLQRMTEIVVSLEVAVAKNITEAGSL